MTTPSRLSHLMLTLALGFPLTASHAAPTQWKEKIDKEIQVAVDHFSGQAGIYIQRILDAQTYERNAEQKWYLSSTVKVFVMIEVLRQAEAGLLSLSDTHKLLKSDYVDGAGPTIWNPVGRVLTLKRLLYRMMKFSDNTATDILIRKVGLENINNTVHSLIPEGITPMTTLLDVRMNLFPKMHPDLKNIGASHFIRMKYKKTTEGRLSILNKWVKSKDKVTLKKWDEVHDQYYAKNLNQATLLAYGTLLRKLYLGEIISKKVSSEALKIMAQCRTGKERIRKGLGPGVVFAHKTGTQYKRKCNVGVAWSDPDNPVVVAVCIKNFTSEADANAFFQKVGRAINSSGILDL